ncbi:MAG: ATP-binding cassette domain-containing protein [Planctomycetota bacterium]
MTSLIALRAAAFGYGGRPVISGVDLEITAAAFLGVVGPNGAGKTTLMRGLLGLLPPLQGTVERSTSSLGYVPQREGLDPVYPLSVQEVVRMGAYARLSRWGRVRPADGALALECLDRVGLADRRRLRFSRLSGGQRQRVLIARALLTRPEVLFLDEPTSGVDLPTQEAILDLLRDLNRREGLAVLLVSHQFEVTRAAAREIIWVADGRVGSVEGVDGLRPERFGASGPPPASGSREEG